MVVTGGRSSFRPSRRVAKSQLILVSSFCIKVDHAKQRADEIILNQRPVVVSVDGETCDKSVRPRQEEKPLCEVIGAVRIDQSSADRSYLSDL